MLKVKTAENTSTDIAEAHVKTDENTLTPIADAYVKTDENMLTPLYKHDTEPPVCEHTYEYSYNWDGATHTATCSECGESFSEECSKDDSGICTVCGADTSMDHTANTDACSVDHYAPSPYSIDEHIAYCVCGREMYSEKCIPDGSGNCTKCGSTAWSLRR